MGLPLLAIVGPTASGKSELAIAVADALVLAGQAAEIVNADSMLVYRGMDIGTAKPRPADLARARHHLVDIMDVTQTASVAEFQQMARRTIAELRACGVVPILVGGSSLYVRAIVDRFDFPGTDPAVRARWEAELERVGASALHAVLAELSPLAAAAILPGNGRRIVRALEIIEINGVHTPHLPEHRYALEDVLQFGLHIERKLMDERIRLRVDRMWADGLVDEVRSLVAEGLREGVTASRGLGYQQVLEHLAGVLTEEESRQATVDGTRRFARKQLGWFRRDPRIRWIEHDDPSASAIIATAALDHGRAS